MSFKLKAADGTMIPIPAGEYYFNTKARGRRMMGNSLSSDARRVYACLELATMGFQQELAVTMGEQRRIRPLTPGDVVHQTGLSKQNVRRGLEELEEAGLAQRVSDDNKALRNGHIRIYSWAVPKPARREGEGSRARLPFPAWFPDSWAPLKPLISRFKYSLIDDEVVARDYFEEIAEAARDYQRAEEVAVRALERVCAGRKRARASLLIKRTERTEEKEPSSSAVRSSSGTGQKAEEEEQQTPYQKFKAAYPAGHFDEAKAKSSFEKKTKFHQAQILERLQVYLTCERWQDEGGQWIPFASKWLESCDAEPPPVLKKAKAAKVPDPGADEERLRRIAANVEASRKWR